MEKVKIGLGRIYNAKACTIFNGDEFSCKFIFGDIEVIATIGPNLRHIVMSGTIGPAIPKDKSYLDHSTRAKSIEYPSPEVFPADLYLELTATRLIDVDNKLADAFFAKDPGARDKIKRMAKHSEQLFTEVLNYTAGALGLRLHYLIVSIPITEQTYAYRKGTSYALGSSITVMTTESYEIDLSVLKGNELKQRLPAVISPWNIKSASEILAWLLRAWNTEDPVLKFVSFFTPLERVIPALPITEDAKKLTFSKRRISSLVKKYSEKEETQNLLEIIEGIKNYPPPIGKRFDSWASKKMLTGWEHDVKAFNKFTRIRNSLFHQGNAKVQFQVHLTEDDVRTIGDIAERYISLALFGDSEIYSSKRN